MDFICFRSIFPATKNNFCYVRRFLLINKQDAAIYMFRTYKLTDIFPVKGNKKYVLEEEFSSHLLTQR